MTHNSSLLTIGGKDFHSRLLTGTGKYTSIENMSESLTKSECEIVTVAIRRVQTAEVSHQGLMETINWEKYWMLPNTAGCTNADEAVRIAKMGREFAKLAGQEENNFIKLEVIPDKKYLLPDPFGTLNAAEQLIKENFVVLPYINADPLLAKKLEEIGCAAVMPLGSAIGSAQGIRNETNIGIIIENANVPVIVDAGIGVPSHAAKAMEMGADAVLINSAIALAKTPQTMAQAMKKAVEAGREGFLAGRLTERQHALPSSPISDISTMESKITQ
ncbi:thiazole synthase [Prochlorococcus marinus]|uniref:thiazole synthase n=1 Tax=Prochlorococcus marinus TaxID=1219 RepID=UPI0022B34C8B|nr:thiazole synthase [Prochlorococcus marinus]